MNALAMASAELSAVSDYPSPLQSHNRRRTRDGTVKQKGLSVVVQIIGEVYLGQGSVISW